MTRSFAPACLAACALLLLAGCNLPGKPGPGPEVPRPDSVVDFHQLYSQNCSGCHGEKGANGAATDLANPEYEAWIDDQHLHDAIANGEKGTLMPAFGKASGGDLTEQQVNAIVQGMRSAWRKSGDAFGGQTPPPYAASGKGDPAHGQAVYEAACARCHAPGKPGGNILDGAYLGLIVPQTIRTTVVPGRPDIGHPDWRSLQPGHPLTDAEVTDVAAWMISQRPANPGQPYPNSQPASAEPRGNEVAPAAQNSPLSEQHR